MLKFQTIKQRSKFSMGIYIYAQMYREGLERDTTLTKVLHPGEMAQICIRDGTKEILTIICESFISRLY